MSQFKIDIVVDSSQAQRGAENLRGALVELEARAGRLTKLLSGSFSSIGSAHEKARREAETLQGALSGVAGEAASVERSVMAMDKAFKAVEKSQKRTAKAIDSAFSDMNKAFKAVEKSQKRTAKAIDSAFSDMNKAFKAVEKSQKEAAKETTGLAKAFSSLEKKANSVSSSIKKGLAIAGVALGGRAISSTLDAYTNVQNRLKLVTRGTDELRDVTQKLFQVAQKTHTSFTATAELYSHTALATKQLGLSQEETLNFTESLNKAVALSGVSSESAAAGLTQLAQGLAAGALRGEELNSVMEQLPRVSLVIQESLGVTSGEMRKLATEGKITAEVIIDAFKKSAKTIDREYGKTVPTIGQSLQQLGNEIIRLVGEFDQATGITEKFGKAIGFLVDNISLVVKAVEALILILGARFAANLLRKTVIPAVLTFSKALKTGAVPAVKSFTVALKANPLGALVSVLQVVIPLVIAFSDEIVSAAKSVSKLAEESALLGGAMKTSFGSFDGVSKRLRQITADANQATQAIENQRAVTNLLLRAQGVMSEALAKTASGQKELEDLTNKQVQAQVKQREEIGKSSRELERARALQDLQNEAKRRGLQLSEATIQQFNREFDATTRAIEQQERRRKSISVQQGPSVLETLAKENQELQRVVAAGVSQRQETIELIDAENQLAASGLKLTDARIAKLKELLAARRKLNAELEAQDSRVTNQVGQFVRRSAEFAKALIEPYQSLKVLVEESEEPFRRVQQILEETADPTELLNQKIADLGLALQTGAIPTIEEYNERLQRLRGETKQTAEEITVLSVIGQRAIQGFADASADSLHELGTSFVDLLGGADDAFEGFAENLKATFKSLVDDLSKALLRLLVLKGIEAALLGGGLSPTAVSGLVGGLPKFQTGGSFRVGGAGGPDSQVVAFRATPGERVDITPTARQAPAEAPSVNVSPTIVNRIDSRDVAESMNSPEGEEVFMNFVRLNPDSIKSILNRS